MTCSEQIPKADGNINKGEHGKPVEEGMSHRNTSAEGQAYKNKATQPSATYPHPAPYGAYVDPSQQHTLKDEKVSDPVNYATYVYPLSPQFSVQYFPDYPNGFQSYPGSPVFHPQSPPIHPSSPPFSPTFQYQSGGPPTHAYMIPSHPNQPFPPAHVTSPILNGVASLPGSPPLRYLPGPYVIADNRKRNHPQQQQQHQHQHHQHQILQQKQYQQQQEYDQQLEDDIDPYHSHNVYIRGLPSSTTDESFLDMCKL
jgi:hypothetical protein